MPTGVKFIKLVTSGGDVSVDNVAGQVEIQSAGGNIQLDDIGGPIDIHTAGRDIKVGSVDGDGRFRTEGGNISLHLVKGNIDARTSGGSILVERGLRNAVLKTGGGDIRMRICAGELKVASGGGNLLLGDIAGRADIRTNGGNIHLHSSQDFVHAETNGGNIHLEGIPAASALTAAGFIVAEFIHSQKPPQNSTLETASGDISVSLPPDLPITIQASVDLGGNHVIRTDMPEIHITRGGDSWPAPIFAEGKLNGGGPILKVHTGNGNIIFQRDVGLATRAANR